MHQQGKLSKAEVNSPAGKIEANTNEGCSTREAEARWRGCSSAMTRKAMVRVRAWWQEDAEEIGASDDASDEEETRLMAQRGSALFQGCHGDES
ncbi:uncharacterized protein DS421_6g188460 [Arachis hypogaea]|nr:uncharacterized protein DS421_6g188460 [Arachis hypogaea]